RPARRQERGRRRRLCRRSSRGVGSAQVGSDGARPGAEGPRAERSERLRGPVGRALERRRLLLHRQRPRRREASRLGPTLRRAAGELWVGKPPPDREYYYAPDDKVTIDYHVRVVPKPPADSGEVVYHRGAETGPEIQRGDLVKIGTARLKVDLSPFKAATDS